MTDPAAVAAASSPRLGPAVRAPSGTKAVQRVMKVRRDYNTLVAHETMEDYALRFTPHGFRKWSALRVANTAFGAASFLVLEAVGATLLVEYGFVNAALAIVATGLVIFLAGWPISVYAARHGVDMDLLTRGAGFGYIGSTVTSLIYASFTFVFFALEAAVMAYALELAFDIPPAWGYLVCALVVVPLVTHGVTVISRLQVWTQPLWIVLLVVPYVCVFANNPGILDQLAAYAGAAGGPGGFELRRFGAAMTVGIALITQMGEQADYLRFMPERRPGRAGAWRWWTAVGIGGPGWVLPGVAKMLGGALLAYLAISHSVPVDRAVDPNQMYLAAYEYLFPRETWAIAATALLVVVSQLKINVTNAYAGSLAWSNFFARLTHSHPGRVVWVVFNTLIALLLMELDVFQALSKVLGLYSNLAISWMMAVVADLVVNKPLGWSPPGIEFKRAHLYDVNPVGVGAMGLASLLSALAYFGLFGDTAQAFSAVIAMTTAFVTAPLIAWATKGRYAIARSPAAAPAGPARCTVCEREYEGEDIAHCPAYLGRICSLCCSLDARCEDMCKPTARWSAQWRAAARRVLPLRVSERLESELGRYLLLMSLIVPALGLLVFVVYRHHLHRLDGATDGLPAPIAATLRDALQRGTALGYLQVFAALVVATGIVTWWLVLTHKSRQVAQEESNRQTQALHEEIESHRRTDEALQDANAEAERARQTADLANHAKTRYLSAISHELRTPLNSILGYAQLLEDDADLPPHRRQAVSVIKRGGDHLLSLIEGTLDIARIEGGKLTLDVAPMRFREGLRQIVRLFELEAAAKGLDFRHDVGDRLPEVVRTDEKRLRQILINVLGNAVKFTHAGQVRFTVRHGREMATFEIEDNGPGIEAGEIDRVFEPFARGSAISGAASGGTGLGLTIAKMLVDLMGGELTVASTTAGAAGGGATGTRFRVRMFLPEVHGAAAGLGAPRLARTGYLGARRRVLVVDNEAVDREWLAERVLAPLGFDVRQAASGAEALALLRGYRPDAILMDLAMPGIDGWETIRRLRRDALSDAPVAIVSANAFDKGLDNDCGVAPADFVLKPVRIAELLDWLGRALAIDWTHAPAAPPAADVPDAAAAVDEAMRLPDASRLRALEEMVGLGYFRGIVKLLDATLAERPDCARFVAHLRGLAREFQLDAMSGVLRRAREAGGGVSEALDRSAADVVLIVDDVPDNLSVLHDALDEAGYTVLVATHGEAALQRAAQAQPDIVLLDAVMPGLDGFEVARRLKAQPETAHIPIVFMTGLTETEHVVAAFQAGGVDYVTKPIRPKEVLARIVAHMHSARQARQARNALDAFGHATIAVRASDRRLVWQTPLARRLLPEYFEPVPPGHLPDAVLDWLAAQTPAATEGREPRPLAVARGARQLVVSLQERTADDDWLIVMREVSDAAVVDALTQSFKLTLREAEVLYWVAKGKTNRDIGDILGASPATVKKHLERVYVKLGVETRTAAASMALAKAR